MERCELHGGTRTGRTVEGEVRADGYFQDREFEPGRRRRSLGQPVDARRAVNVVGKPTTRERPCRSVEGSSGEERASRTRVLLPGDSDAAAIGPPTLPTRCRPCTERGTRDRCWARVADNGRLCPRAPAVADEPPPRRADPCGRDDRRRATATATPQLATYATPARSSRSRQRLFSPRSLRPGYLSGQNGDYPNDWHCRVLTKAPIFQPDSRPRSREPRHTARTATLDRGRLAHRTSATGERTFT